MGTTCCKECIKSTLNIDLNQNDLEPLTETTFHLIYSKQKINNKIRLFGSLFINKNKTKCILIMNGVEKQLIEFYEVNDMDNEFLEVDLIVKENITDLSHMFHGCSLLISLDFTPGENTAIIKNMSYMFYNCSSLTKISNLSSLNMSQVKNISFMFAGCSSLKHLGRISEWDLSNAINISNLFCECSSLTDLSDISKWNTIKIRNMSYLFY